jgi:hypothetical protein
MAGAGKSLRERIKALNKRALETSNAIEKARQRLKAQREDREATGRAARKKKREAAATRDKRKKEEEASQYPKVFQPFKPFLPW